MNATETTGNDKTNLLCDEYEKARDACLTLNTTDAANRFHEAAIALANNVANSRRRFNEYLRGSK